MVEAKGRDKTQCRAWARYWSCSNSLFGLPYDANERRIFAVVCNATEPREPEFLHRNRINVSGGRGVAGHRGDAAAICGRAAGVARAAERYGADTGQPDTAVRGHTERSSGRSARHSAARQRHERHRAAYHGAVVAGRRSSRATAARRVATGAYNGRWRQRAVLDLEAKFRIKSMTRCAAESWTVTRRGWCDGRGGRRKASKNASHASQKRHRFQPMLAGLQYLFVTL